MIKDDPGSSILDLLKWFHCIGRKTEREGVAIIEWSENEGVSSKFCGRS